MALPMHPVPDEPISGSARFGSPAIWFAFLGGAVIWAVHFLVTYGLVYVTCATGITLLLYLPTIIAAPLVILSIMVAWRLWQQPLRDSSTTQHTMARTRFFGLAGVIADVIFLAAILFAGVTPLFLDACGATP